MQINSLLFTLYLFALFFLLDCPVRSHRRRPATRSSCWSPFRSRLHSGSCQSRMGPPQLCATSGCACVWWRVQSGCARSCALRGAEGGRGGKQEVIDEDEAPLAGFAYDTINNGVCVCNWHTNQLTYPSYPYTSTHDNSKLLMGTEYHVEYLPTNMGLWYHLQYYGSHQNLLE